MKVLILGGDGYLGWSTAMYLSDKGHEVVVVDNYLRRNACREIDVEPLIQNPNLHERVRIWEEVSGNKIQVHIGDCCDYNFLSSIITDEQPEAVIHYAEQPSGPYSMIDQEKAQLTLNNNVSSTLNLAFAVFENAPDCHIIKLGTMGEYGTPNIDIEEGWLEVEHKGRKHKFLYPRQTGSLYHTTKIMDTDLLWFYVRMKDLRVSDLMQGPVYGLHTPQTRMDERLLPNFNYDDVFGTVINRFVVQAVAGHPLTVYGKGGQVRGYLNINDTLQCIELALENPANKGELRIMNQFVETLSVNEIAEKVKKAGDELGLGVKIKPIKNPRKEPEEHYYNPQHTKLLELGLDPHYLTQEVMKELLQEVMDHKEKIDKRKILPRVQW